MEALKQILSSHAEKYPHMQPTDAVKLLYQNEFGGGHMIADEESCMDYLRKEYVRVEKNPDLPLYEPIGNDMVRVCLAALPAHQLEELGHAFIRSANAHTGSLPDFLKKIRILRSLTEEGKMPFSTVELDAYLQDYEKVGYPVVSHSEIYRQTYAPAYRVVKTQYLKGC